LERNQQQKMSRQRRAKAATPQTMAAISRPVRPRWLGVLETEGTGPVKVEDAVTKDEVDKDEAEDDTGEVEDAKDEEEEVLGVEVALREDVDEVGVGVAVEEGSAVVDGGAIVGEVALVVAGTLVDAGDVRPPYVHSGPSGIYEESIISDRL
jgi:hypothetical protein